MLMSPQGDAGAQILPFCCCVFYTSLARNRRFANAVPDTEHLQLPFCTDVLSEIVVLGCHFCHKKAQDDSRGPKVAPGGPKMASKRPRAKCHEYGAFRIGLLQKDNFATFRHVKIFYSLELKVCISHMTSFNKSDFHKKYVLMVLSFSLQAYLTGMSRTQRRSSNKREIAQSLYVKIM